MMKFVQTCQACPEQYDVFDENMTQIAYIRLRHGCLTVTCPGVSGDIVYETTAFKGDGCFMEHSDRIKHLSAAIRQIEIWQQLAQFKEFDV